MNPYAVLFTPIPLFTSWAQSFTSIAFNVIKYPYTIATNPEQVQTKVVSDFPQESAYFSMVAKLLGTHPSRFTPKFNCDFHLMQCNTERRYFDLWNAPCTKRKLTHPKAKAKFWVEEKLGNVIAEIVDTYVLQSGMVLDLFSGRMPTGTGFIISKRGCILNEKDTLYLRSAERKIDTMIEILLASNSSADKVPITEPTKESYDLNKKELHQPLTFQHSPK